MNDRELLEAAAKAAGYEVKWWERDKKFSFVHAKDGGFWNPIDDDGDALRLAVKLRIHVEHTGQSAKPADQVQASPRGHGHLGWVEMYGDDAAKATRRAIVRSAALMGMEMQ